MKTIEKISNTYNDTHGSIKKFNDKGRCTRNTRMERELNGILEELHPIIKVALNDTLESILKYTKESNIEVSSDRLLKSALVDAVLLQNYLDKLIKKHTPYIGTKKSFQNAELNKVTPAIGKAILDYKHKYDYENFDKIDTINLVYEEKNWLQRMLSNLFSKN